MTHLSKKRPLKERGANSAVGEGARFVIQAQVWLQVQILTEEGLSPGVNMCANSISPRASPSDETINRGPRQRPVCVANRAAKSSRHPVHKVFGQLNYNPNIYLFLVIFFQKGHKSDTPIFTIFFVFKISKNLNFRFLALKKKLIQEKKT